MRITAYRLTQRRYQDDAYTGAGSLRRNGRWHRAGIPMVYAAASPAAAVLEVMVHVERLRLLAMELVVVPCHFDPSLMERVDAYIGAAGLPPDWRSFPWPRSTQRLGGRWFGEGRTMVLEVPSAVIPAEKNYLTNPEHPRFGEVTVEAGERFEVDPRLGR